MQIDIFTCTLICKLEYPSSSVFCCFSARAEAAPAKARGVNKGPFSAVFVFACASSSRRRQKGVNGRPLLWLDNYMENRRARARVDGVFAGQDRHFELGVPQGGLLGPILWAIYDSDNPIGELDGGHYADDGHRGSQLQLYTRTTPT